MDHFIRPLAHASLSDTMSDETRPLSLVALALFEIILSICLAIPPICHRGLFLFSSLLGLYCHIITSTTGHPRTDWALALSITPQLGKAFDLLLLVDAEKSLRRCCNLANDPSQLSIFGKLCWSFEVVHTPRGVGWNWETPFICYNGSRTRRYRDCLNKNLRYMSVLKFILLIME